MSDAASLVKIASGEEEALLPITVEKNERTTRARFIPKLLKLVGRIPFADDLAASWYCAHDQQTPRKVKAILFAALAYFVIPTDLLPDVIAALGFTDDATVLATALGIVGSHITPEHRRKARRLLRMPEPEAGNPA